MRRLVSRLAAALPVVVLATFLVFCLLELVPGDPAVALAGESGTPERLAEIRQMLGLDRPFLIQYLSWLAHAVQGDLSHSLLSGVSVARLIAERLPATLLLTCLSLLLSVGVGVPLGVVAATRPGSLIDRAIGGLTTLFVAVPSFWLGMVLVSYFALEHEWFPATGMPRLSENARGALGHAILPALALCANGAALVARQVKGGLGEVLVSQYVRTLRAKGLSRASIVWKHGLRNIAGMLLTTIGLLFNRLLSITVVMEAVFAIPGLGSLVVPASLGKDVPVVQGVVLVTAVTVVLVNLATDMLVGWLDPRARTQPGT